MKKILLSIIIISLLLSSCSGEEKISEQKYYKTGIVSSGSIDNDNSFVGYTDSFNNVTLSAKIGGRVVSISKNVGDRVKIGDEVATLDSSEALTGYSSSENIIASLNTLKSSTSGMYDMQIQIMQEQIKSAEKGVEIANTQFLGSEAGTDDTININNSQLSTIDAQIIQAQIGLETAKLQLENGKNTLVQKEDDIYKNSKNAISNANILGDNLIDFLDNLYGITELNKNKNDDFEIYISGKNVEFKNQINNDFRALLTNFLNLKNLSTNTNDEIKTTLEKYNDFFSDDIREILILANKTMENSITSIDFSENSVSIYKSQITSFQTKNESVILSVSGNYFLGLKGSMDSISSIEKEKKSSIDVLEKQVELAEKQIETLKQTKNQVSYIGKGQLTDIYIKTDVTKKQLELSKNSLEESKLGLKALEKQKESSLQEIETQIVQVKSGKADAGIMIQNGKIISLIDGIVTKKMTEVGQVVGAGTPILMVSSDNKIKMEVQLSDEVLSKISLGEKIDVEIESLDERKIGELTKILPTRDELTKKGIIEITLDNKKGDIKIGSYSKVYFDFGSIKNGIIIPNSSILSNMLVPGVYVIENSKAVLKNITIINQSDSYSEVEGVNIGDKIIIEGKENIYDQEFLP